MLREVELMERTKREAVALHPPLEGEGRRQANEVSEGGGVG